MATSCPVDLDTQKLREEIRSIYERVATDPSGEFHFHRGPQYAAEFLNYNLAALDRLPSQSTTGGIQRGVPHPQARWPVSLRRYRGG